MATQIIMPQLGESIVEGTVVKWLKSKGETIANLEPLLEVETDKVVSEIPSPAEGVLLEIIVPEGTTVKIGTVVAWVGAVGEPIPAGGEVPDTGSTTHKEQQPAAVATTPTLPAPQRELGFISPVVAKITQEHAVDLRQVKGTGTGGRITKKDVLAYLDSRTSQVESPKATIPIWETPADGDLFRPTELVFAKQVALSPVNVTPANVTRDTGTHDTLLPHTTIRKHIADHMLMSKNVAPHVTTVMEADLSKVVAHRTANKAAFERDGANLTYTVYFVAAAVAALKTHPRANSSWSDEGLIVHSAINIGMATSLGEEGLIVPVIKGADGLSLLGIARAVNELAERARGHKLQPEEVKGGTFTITNHGVANSLFATPIINQPQCAILGVGAIQKRVVVIDDSIAIRPMVYLSLSFDHRILDGASADWFLAKVVEVLQNWS
jgi:2-oxoglutarate dehydrogenase E2 component (dihydrolipoamide succinyltransferase)